MSCQHGNWEPCDECIALASEYQSGFEQGKKDGWEACETCHGIVDGKHQESESLRAQIAELEAENEQLKKEIDKLYGEW